MVYPNQDGDTHSFVWSCCGGTVVEDHTKEQVGDPIPPHCGEYGYTVYHCDVCGEYFNDDYTDPLPHAGTQTGVEEPTCTEIGYAYFICDTCGVTCISEVFSPTGHTPGRVLEVVAPTCEQDGFTRYTCATCGEDYTDDVTAAIGHAFAANGFCMNCGLDKNTGILITMTQKWGDGWGRNGIAVFEDGVEIGVATVESGKGFAEWSWEMDPQKQYRFCWQDGQYAKDCAFTISVMGQVVFTAEYGDCEAYTYNQQLYPFCDHDYQPTGVTPPTCYSYGYTTYTCTLCGTFYDGDFTDPAHCYDAGVLTPPTCTKGGYTLYTCAYCGNSYAADLTDPSHVFNGGYCMYCGEEDPNYEVVVPVTATIAGNSLSFEDEIKVNVYYTVSDMTNVVEQGVLVFYTNPVTVDVATADESSANAEISGKYYKSTTKGIAAKQMGDDRYYCAYVKLADGTYAYSSVLKYSPKDYATNMLASTTSSQKQKVLCVAMLNYGAAAQQYFGYKTDSLMNAGLTAAQQAMVAPYSESYFKGAQAVDSGKTGIFGNEYGFTRNGKSVSFEGAFSINYYFLPSYEVNGNVTLYVWNANTYANVNQLTAANANQAITATKANGGVYSAIVKGIAAKTLDETIYVAAVYTNANGEACCSGVIAYSLSTYCMNTAAGNMGALAQATAMYGYYAAQYFAN
jgi:hypothetical protein